MRKRLLQLSCLVFALVLLGGGLALAVDGDLATSFSDDGVLSADFGSGVTISEPSDGTLDSSGRLVVVGKADLNIGVARFNPDGSYDSSFGGDGRVAFNSNPSGSGEAPQAVAIDALGRIVVVGTADNDLVVARLDGTDGSLDPSFDGPVGALPGDGVFRLDASLFDTANDVAIDGSGTNILISANQNNDTPAVTRLDENGVPDATFGSGDGTILVPFGTSSFGAGLAVQADGKILLAGRQNGSGGMGLARIKADGSGLDTAGFNVAGTPGLNVTSPPAGKAEARGFDVAIDAAGRIVVSGDASGGVNGNDLALARFTAAGVLDAGFGSAGYVVLPMADSQFPGGFAIQPPDGKLLVAGSGETGPGTNVFDPVAARFLADGTALDATFSPDAPAGVVTPSFGHDAQANALALSDQGVAYLVGPGFLPAFAVEIDVAAVQAFPPEIPTALTTDPVGPADENSPLVKGSVPPGTTNVNVFADPACSGTPLATGSGDDFAGAGIPVAVADNTTTTFYAASSWAGGTSACSTSFATYTELTPVVTPPPTTTPPTTTTPTTTTPTTNPTPSPAVSTGQRALALKKCAKVRNKTKKKRCKTRARKLPV